MFTKQELDELEELVAENLLFAAKCRINAPSDEFPDIDPNTLQPIQTEGALKYDGGCMVGPTTRINERSFAFGEVKQASRTYTVRVDKDFIDCNINDVITVYESEDPMFADLTLTVIDPQASTTAAQRVIIAEIALGH